MKSTLTGLGIMGVAVMIGLKTRGNTHETATETFGTLALILVLVLIGFSFVRKGEAERVRNAGRKKSSPPKGGFTPPKMGGHHVGGARPFPGAQASSSSFEVPEGLTKAVIGILILIVGGVSAYGAKMLLIPSDLKKLAEIESPGSAVKGELKLNPVLDKVADRYGTSRGDVDDVLFEVWESNGKAYVEYGLKPSSLARELVSAAPKEDADLEEIAGKIAEEKPAARMARLNQAKPTFGSYPQEAQFQKILDALAKKTGMSQKALTAALVSRWKVVYSKKKKNPKYALLPFTSAMNDQTKSGMKKAEFLSKLEKYGK